MKRNLWLKNDKKRIDEESTQASLDSLVNNINKSITHFDEKRVAAFIGSKEYKESAEALKVLRETKRIVHQITSNALSEEEIKDKMLKLVLAYSIFKRDYEQKPVPQE